MILGDTNGLIIPARGRPTIRDHKLLETYLERFAGLMFYLREMDESVYGKLCAVRLIISNIQSPKFTRC